MASKQLNIALAVFVIVLLVAMATEFLLLSILIHSVFKYMVGLHNVFKVNGTVFTNCTIPPANEAFTTGNDEITLATPGRKWYICGLAITVVEEWASPAPAPSPSTPTATTPSFAYGISVSGYQLLMATRVVVAFLLV
ncbi:hypothetical protein AAG906_031323 [Vitis piasezkii]